MRLIGFIREHDAVIESTTFDTAFAEIENDPHIVQVVTEYLNKGKLFFGWMEYFTDLASKERIAPHGYYTDGEYIWPAYYPYYLTKYSNYLLDEEFAIYVQVQREPKPLSGTELKKIEDFLLTKFGKVDEP